MSPQKKIKRVYLSRLTKAVAIYTRKKADYYYQNNNRVGKLPFLRFAQYIISVC